MRSSTLFLLSLAVSTAFAADGADNLNPKGRPPTGKKHDSVIVEDVDTPRLTDHDEKALALAEQITTPATPIAGRNGRLLFPFGRGQPRVVCEPLHTTDIALQPGEVIKLDGVNAGDTAAWQISPAISGAQGNETIHVIVKPVDFDLETNLIIATDRRTYNIDLVSAKGGYMPSVGFSYPEDAIAAFHAIEEREKQVKAANTLPETGEDITKLNFDYDIDGKAPWKPLRVYNNGKKTIVQMPAAMKAGEAPALIVIGRGDEQQMVNYRLLGDRYIVDMVFTKAVLVLGVGRHQTKVTITKID